MVGEDNYVENYRIGDKQVFKNNRGRFQNKVGIDYFLG